MKIIALVPVRNEAWVLEHSLACWSGFCDAVIVADQRSNDASREICRRFPKAVLLEAAETQAVDRLPQQARWRLLDAARQFDGNNLLWCTDADELTPPALAKAYLERHADELTPRRVVECRFYNMWNGVTSYRQDLSVYGPRWKPMAFVDDRIVDYPRSPDLRPLHEPRMPVETDASALKAEGVPVLHLQFAMWNRNQVKQAWYRCIEWLDRRASAAQINDFYSITLPSWYVHTERVPAGWLGGVTLPPASIDLEPWWHEAEILAWFDRHGVEFFEPLEIWHVPALRTEFRRRTGRSPRPDRSYAAPWPAQVKRLGRRIFNAARRRIVPGSR